MYVALSGSTLLISVMSQQYNCLMQLYTNFYKISFVMKMYLPSSLILRYVRAEMNVHAFMNELDQMDYWYPRKIKNCENLCTKSMESCPLVISHILAEFHPERATSTTLHNHLELLNGLSNSAQTFTVGFVKLLSTHPIHIVVWGNFPLKAWIIFCEDWRTSCMYLFPISLIIHFFFFCFFLAWKRKL